jgi:hypothetical protein
VRNAFNTLPMAIIEVSGDRARFIRTNPSYRTFMTRAFGIDMATEMKGYVKYQSAFMQNIIQSCSGKGIRAFFSEKTGDGSVIHSFARRIGVNPVTGDTAVAIGVLSIADARTEESYADLARALASDYYKMYMVDLDTEHYIEYSSAAGQGTLAIERKGTGFFETAVNDTMPRICAEDREDFLRWFTKEQLAKAADGQGTAMKSYRLIEDGSRMNVSMKVTRMQGSNRIILGVSILSTEEP